MVDPSTTMPSSNKPIISVGGQWRSCYVTSYMHEINKNTVMCIHFNLALTCWFSVSSMRSLGVQVHLMLASSLTISVKVFTATCGWSWIHPSAVRFPPTLDRRGKSELFLFKGLNCQGKEKKK